MSLTFRDITFDCADPEALAAFWAQTLDRSFGTRTEDHTSLPPAAAGEPTLHFIKVPEGKTAKNRVHFDLGTSDLAAEVARLVGLGATPLTEHRESGYVWTVMHDPEGNEFCVVETA